MGLEKDKKIRSRGKAEKNGGLSVSGVTSRAIGRPVGPRDEGDGESAPDVPRERNAETAVTPEEPDSIHPVRSRNVSGQRKEIRFRLTSPVRFAPHSPFRFSVEVDALAVFLLVLACATRFYRLEEPRYIVFDELHYGKFAHMYQKQMFFFDSQPPLGKQLVALAVHLAGYRGESNFTFSKIGAPYSPEVPVAAMRFVPALCGGLLVPAVYLLVVEMGFSHFAAGFAALLVLLDNGILCQSRYVLMESQLLLFAALGLLLVLKATRKRPTASDYLSPAWWLSLCFGVAFLACAVCVKFVGFFSLCLGGAVLARYLWRHIPDKSISAVTLFAHALIFCAVFVTIPILVYLLCFYVHLSILTKAGPHDNVMTSHFQASLEGGLAAVIRNQPLEVVHGSQITLKHTHGRPCWLHSHEDTYPIKYPDGRGSSHQQQVTCYSFKDVNNWWIVKRPERNDLVVSEPKDKIKHGDIVQLVHGLSSRALNSHDVAAPMSPQHQEVSCYIDYNISMPAHILWRVDIINRDKVGDIWHTVESQVRLIHLNSSQALKVSGKQLPEWGYNQYEVVTDRLVEQVDAVWNVEEHRHTRNQAQKEREREIILHEMIPLEPTRLTFWEKMMELQVKMLLLGSDSPQQHMYMSSPLEWPLLTRGIAYWVSTESNAQVHLLGNIVVWLTGTACMVVYFGLLVFYMMRRRRLCYDVPEDVWEQFRFAGEILFVGYLTHFLPYFLTERTLFLYNYFPALMFKILIVAALFDHFRRLATTLDVVWIRYALRIAVICWLSVIVAVFWKFLPLTYGLTPLTKEEVDELRWRDTWDLIVHKK